jgi:uncharacterized protein (DUF486 family)
LVFGKLLDAFMPDIVSAVRKLWRRANKMLRQRRYDCSSSRQIDLRQQIRNSGNISRMRTILLLTCSNIFMTFAWYGHLKYKSAPLFKVIVISWMIAFFEYCFQVPANRIGSYEFSVAQLKTIQEVITLTVFAVFSILYFHEELKWNYFAGFALIVCAVFVIFKKW